MFTCFSDGDVDQKEKVASTTGERFSLLLQKILHIHSGKGLRGFHLLLMADG